MLKFRLPKAHFALAILSHMQHQCLLAERAYG